MKAQEKVYQIIALQNEIKTIVSSFRYIAYIDGFFRQNKEGIYELDSTENDNFPTHTVVCDELEPLKKYCEAFTYYQIYVDGKLINPEIKDWIS